MVRVGVCSAEHLDSWQRLELARKPRDALFLEVEGLITSDDAVSNCNVELERAHYRKRHPHSGCGFSVGL